MATIEHREIQTPAPAARAAEPLRQSLRALLGELSWPGAADQAGQLRTLGLTSCLRGEGVSTVAAQLAVQAAGLSARRVLLVDFNVQQPSVHHTFHVDQAPGLVEVAAGRFDLWSAARQTSIENLWVLPAGVVDRPGQPSCDPVELPALVQELEGEFDFVVFDMPGVLEHDSTSRLASLLDGVVLVVEAERIRWDVAQRGQQQLVQAQARLLGAVLNKRQQPIPAWLDRLI